MLFLTQFDPVKIGAYLKMVSRRQRTVTYGDLKNKFGLPDFDVPCSQHPLSQIFEILDQQDANAVRPFHTSIVITASGNGPGAGYFEALKRLKNIPDPCEKKIMTSGLHYGCNSSVKLMHTIGSRNHDAKRGYTWVIDLTWRTA